MCAAELEFGERKKHLVANTALRLVASMKRDWMQASTISRSGLKRSKWSVND